MLRIYKDARHRAQKWNVGPEYRKRLEQPCGYFGKRTPFLRWRVQLQDTREILHSAKDLGVGIANYIELLIYKTLQNYNFAVLRLNLKVNKPPRLSHVTPH